MKFMMYRIEQRSRYCEDQIISRFNNLSYFLLNRLKSTWHYLNIKLSVLFTHALTFLMKSQLSIWLSKGFFIDLLLSLNLWKTHKNFDFDDFITLWVSSWFFFTLKQKTWRKSLGFKSTMGILEHLFKKLSKWNFSELKGCNLAFQQKSERTTPFSYFLMRLNNKLFNCSNKRSARGCF